MCKVCNRPDDVCYELNIWQWWHEDATADMDWELEEKILEMYLDGELTNLIKR